MPVNCYQKLIHATVPALDNIRLPFDSRAKSRGRASSEQGHEVCWFLTRGTSLVHGDKLQAESGEVFEIVAADEPVSCIKSKTPLQLMRAAYHLGNRHVSLHIAAGELRYQPDHVLDEMIAGLGLNVEHCSRPFQPEDGAYHTHHHHE